MNQLWAVSFPYWHLALRAVVVYVSVLILLRLGGKRQIGQMGAGEAICGLNGSNTMNAPYQFHCT